MKERPILFSDPMVRAILSGQKTQTRRVVKPEIALHMPAGANCGSKQPFRCPYGQPGDRLWVREAIRHQGSGVSTYSADGSITVADAWPWKRNFLPPMHCPRGLSRILLEIVSVRVERLQDISEADARAEGVDDRMILNAVQQTPNPLPPSPYVGGFRWLWESINGAESWAVNPWVWVVEFRRVQP